MATPVQSCARLPRRGLGFGSFFAVLCFLLLSVPQPAGAVLVRLVVQDELGNIIPFRVSLRDGQGQYFPAGPDSVLMSHYGSPFMNVYFYPQGLPSMQIGRGVATITVGRGFEWRPVRFTADVQRDTVLAVTLRHPFNLRAEGWYSGDNHTHTTHVPSEYTLTPERMHRIIQAEDLAIAWVLDNEYEFTGGPHSVSTPDATLYFTTEYRNQAYGHVALLGLKQIIGVGCCTPPAPAYPMLSDLRETWAPAWDEAMSLNHPRSGADFFDDEGGWPAWGLGREVPIQAASGNLDSYDIASYSNEGDVWLDDWYRLLNCGFHVPGSAGTDAIMNQYFIRPTGGYRVYVKDDGSGHDPAHWVEGLKAGRVFVTNYPLIPEFTVDGAEAGSMVDLPGPAAVVPVHFVVKSVLSVSRASLIRNGAVVATFVLPGGPNGTWAEINTTVPLTESSWLALRVDGATTLPHAASSSLFAHTGAVYIRLDGAEVARSLDAGHLSDWVDSLQIFVEHRGGWYTEAQRTHVLQRLQDGREFYARYFHLPPNTFGLLQPRDGDTLSTRSQNLFDWGDAADPEPGDRIQYRVAISADTAFSSGYLSSLLTESQLLLTQMPVPAGRVYWWRVTALDRAGNSTRCTPGRSWFYLSSSPAAVEPDMVGQDSRQNQDAAGGPAARISVWPNPSSGPVRFEWTRPAPWGGVFEICDAGGRCIRRIRTAPAGGDVARTGGSSSNPGGVWNGTDAHGRTVSSGLYWVRYRPTPLSPTSPGASGGGGARVLILR